MTTRGVVLVERAFEVPVSAGDAWAALADVPGWPAWAPHITRARLTPPGPLGPASAVAFHFRPAGGSRFSVTAYDPPCSWTWTGGLFGLTIDYDHRFEPVTPTRTRLVWVVRTREAPGVRARLFAAVYSRMIDRAWPRFAVQLAA